MEKRTLISIGLGVASVACAVGVARQPPPHPVVVTSLEDSDALGDIRGVAADYTTSKRLSGVVVILDCSCLSEVRETETDADGIYLFSDLPPGDYRIQALYRQDDVNRLHTLKPGTRARVNFTLRDESFVRT